MNSVTVTVPAKVNLQLAVGAPRADGYHELVTVFHAVSLYDEVTVTPAAGLGVDVEGPADAVRDVPLDRTNLAARAAELLAARLGRDPDVRITIRKGIPVAGGMAGGSADAAATLLACATLWGADGEDLAALGADLGSDVPFSGHGGTAVGTGRGERLTPVAGGGRFHWVFALADGGLSTPAVYRECDRLRDAAGAGVPEPAVSRDLLAALRAGDPFALGAALVNDLQPAALSLRPSLAATLAAGTAAGACGAIVSGSGPTCAFLAPDAAAADVVAKALLASGTCRDARTAYGEVPGARVVPRPGGGTPQGR